jgi:hypothetical protein
VTVSQDLNATRATNDMFKNRIERLTSGKYERRMNEFKVWLLETGSADGTDRERRMWGYLVAPPDARNGFDPHAHPGAARRAKLRLDHNFDVLDWCDFIMTRTIGKGKGRLLKGIGSLAGYRSAFNSAWTDAIATHAVQRPAGLEERIKTFFTSLAKQDAKAAEDRRGGVAAGRQAEEYDPARGAQPLHMGEADPPREEEPSEPSSGHRRRNGPRRRRMMWPNDHPGVRCSTPWLSSTTPHCWPALAGPPCTCARHHSTAVSCSGTKNISLYRVVSVSSPRDPSDQCYPSDQLLCRSLGPLGLPTPARTPDSAPHRGQTGAARRGGDDQRPPYRYIALHARTMWVRVQRGGVRS